MRRSLRTSRVALLVAFVLFFPFNPSHAGPKDPITGPQFNLLIAAQNAELQAHLRSLYPETDGYFVTSPLDPFFQGDDDAAPLYKSIRIICADVLRLQETIAYAKGAKIFKKIATDIDKARSKKPAGFRGAIATLVRDEGEITVEFNTGQQTRWLIWAQKTMFGPGKLDSKKLDRYAVAVSDYLYAIDQGNLDAPEPKATEFGLPESADFYPPAPPYVIEGYDAYKKFLSDHAGISTDFAQGILAFIPTDSLVGVLESNAPAKAWPNKEQPMLQSEYRKFFARGGDPLVIRTLTAESFAHLKPGEYFFAVGCNGLVRYGHEMPREEVERIETETGKKVPRANHGFLFPGEPILTAGAFFIVADPKPRISHVNAQSGHYFYSNVSETIREDIAVHSNEYLLTLGHFFRALDHLGITYDSILVSKM